MELLKKWFLILIITVWLLLSSCAATGLLGVAAKTMAGGSTPLVDATVTGEAKNQAVRLSNETTNTDKRQIKTGDGSTITDDDTTTIYNKQMSTPVLILLVLGWFLPSPKECGKLLLDGIRGLRKALLGR